MNNFSRNTGIVHSTASRCFHYRSNLFTTASPTPLLSAFSDNTLPSPQCTNIGVIENPYNDHFTPQTILHSCDFRAGQRPAHAWFLKITSVRMYACVCVCVRPRITSGVI